MQNLLWCFLSFRGELNRHQFILATVALALLFFLASRIGTHVFIGVTGSDGGWTPLELNNARREGAGLAGMFRFWPLLALQIKRVRHIGLPVRYLMGAYGASIALLVLAPGLSHGMNEALFLFLMLAGGGSFSLARKKTR